MYKIIETYLVYTSEGEVILYVDETGDLHVMSNNRVAIEEATTKYFRRKL